MKSYRIKTIKLKSLCVFPNKQITQGWTRGNQHIHIPITPCILGQSKSWLMVEWLFQNIRCPVFGQSKIV